MKIFLLALLFSLLALPARGWWCMGHMTTAELAKRKMRPQTVALVDRSMAALGRMGPFPKVTDMVTSGCWSDDIKDDDKYTMMNEWHFIDRPYNPLNMTIAKDPVTSVNVENVIMALKQVMVSNRNNVEGWVLATGLAQMIHFYGDIHMPLHATQRYDKLFPEGDRGGNLWKVTYKGDSTNLHAFWDSICWKWKNDLERPLSKENREKVVKYSNELHDKFSGTFKEEELHEYNSTIYALESFNTSIDVVYKGIDNELTDLTEEYQKTCLEHAERRVALGGLRLGLELEYLLGGVASELAAKEEAELGFKILRRLARLRDSVSDTTRSIRDDLEELLP